jgi:peroxiredoxin
MAIPAMAQQPTNAPAAAAPAPQLPIPAVGDLAPDFSIRGSTRYGLLRDRTLLSAYRGQTVVLAFFVIARTRGWTVQLEAYRDQYATIFNNGKKVVVIGISTDADTTLTNWANEASFPFLFASDSGQVIGKLYGSIRGQYDARNLFVIAPDGRIAHRMTPFNVLSQDAYTELERAVDQAAGTTAPKWTVRAINWSSCIAPPSRAPTWSRLQRRR